MRRNPLPRPSRRLALLRNVSKATDDSLPYGKEQLVLQHMVPLTHRLFR